MRRAATFLLVGALAAACLPGGGQLHTTLPGGADGPPPLPVTLDDRTGLVTGIGQPPIAGDIGFADGLSNLPGRSDVLVVGWTSGACTERTQMLFEPTAAGYRLQLVVVDRPGACIAIGYGRALAIELGAPLDSDSVELAVGR